MMSTRFSYILVPCVLLLTLFACAQGGKVFPLRHTRQSSRSPTSVHVIPEGQYPKVHASALAPNCSSSFTSGSPPQWCFTTGLVPPYNVPCRVQYMRCIVDPAGGPNDLCLDPYGIGIASQWGMRQMIFPAAAPAPNGTGNLYNGTSYFALSMGPFWNTNGKPLGMSVTLVPTLPTSTPAFRLGIAPGSQWANANASCLNSDYSGVISTGPAGRRAAATLEWEVGPGKWGCTGGGCVYNFVVENTLPEKLTAWVYLTPYIVPTVVSATAHAPGTPYQFNSTGKWGGGSLRHFGYIPTRTAIAGYTSVNITATVLGGNNVKVYMSTLMYGHLKQDLEVYMGSKTPKGLMTYTFQINNQSPFWCETDASARPVYQGCYYHISLASAYGADVQLTVQYFK